MSRALPRNAKRLKTLRAHLRQRMPAPELVLWGQLRLRQFGVKFRRQVSFGNMVVDFYAPSARIAIEVDGDSHYRTDGGRARDRRRDEVLNRDGVQVLRFTNHEVMRNLDGVCERIHEVVLRRLHSTPS